MLRLPPFDKIGVTPTPDFVNADPTNSVAGSIVNGLIFNILQHEGENLALLAGLAPDGTNLTQWTQAISRGGMWCGALTGTGDLAVATLGAVLPALLQGMRVGAVATATNTTTTPKLRVMNLGSIGLYQDYPIIFPDGTTPAIGGIKAGRLYRYEADGAGNVIISGGGISTGGGYVGELTTLTKSAKQAFSGAATEMSVTWDALATAPSWATFNGTTFTVTQKCRVISVLGVSTAVSISAAGYVESDVHIAINGTDTKGKGQSAWPNTNTTYLPTLDLVSILDLNVGDIFMSRAAANAANFNGAFVLGRDGSYGISDPGTAWQLLCVSKG